MVAAAAVVLASAAAPARDNQAGARPLRAAGAVSGCRKIVSGEVRVTWSSPRGARLCQRLASAVLLLLVLLLGPLFATANPDPWVEAKRALEERRFDAALPLLQAMVDADDPLARARGLTGLTAMAIKLGKAPERKHEIEQAITLLRTLPQARADLAYALVAAAEVAAAGDDSAARLRFGEEAIAIYGDLPDRERELMDALLRTSNADGRLGNRAAGEAKVQRAAEIADRIGVSPIERVRILGRQAAFAYGRGAPDEAAERYAQMRTLAAEHAPETLEYASALANGAIVAADRGHLAGARRDFEQALQLRQRLGGRSQMIASDLVTLAEIETRLGDLEAAFGHLDDARKRFAEIDSRSELHVAVLVKLALVLFDRGDATQAGELFEQAQTLAEGLDYECACKAHTLIWLSWYQLRVGQAEAALAGYQRAFDLYREAQSKDINLAYAQGGRAEALIELERYAEAQVALTDSMPALVELAPDSAGHARLLWMQGRIAEGLGDPRVARERYCAASHILDRASLAGGDDVGQARFRRRYVEVYRACIEAAARDDDAAAVFDGLERLRLRRAAGESAVAVREVASLAQVQQRLPADSVLLSFLSTPDALHVLLVRDRRARLLRLPVARATLASEVATLRGRVLARVDVDDADLRASGRRLYDALLAPVADELRGHRQLLLAPDGPLHELPWAVLHDGRRWLIERHALTIVDTWTDAPTGQPQAGEMLLGVADAGDGALPATALRDAPLAPLAHAREEVAGLRRIGSEVTMLAGSDATETSVRARLPEAAVAHFAVHAWLNVEQPMQSALLLQPAAGARAESDGLLQAFEIAALRLPARLVVLSGCDTARGAELEGVGLLGLVRAFRSAGAQRVIASLWPIADQGTAELFARYYVSGDGDPAYAWQRTARSALSKPVFTSSSDVERGVGGVTRRAADAHLLPYHWASLQVYGQPAVNP